MPFIKLILIIAVTYFMHGCNQSIDANIENPTYYNYKGEEGSGDLRHVDISTTMHDLIDITSIRREGDLAIVWTVSNFRGDLLAKMKTKQNASSVKNLETYNCREKTVNGTDFIAFSEPWLGGEEVSRGTFTEGIQPVLKNSVAEVKMIILCKYPQTPVPISVAPTEKKLADVQSEPQPVAAPESTGITTLPISVPKSLKNIDFQQQPKDLTLNCKFISSSTGGAALDSILTIKTKENQFLWGRNEIENYRENEKENSFSGTTQAKKVAIKGVADKDKDKGINITIDNNATGLTLNYNCF